MPRVTWRGFEVLAYSTKVYDLLKLVHVLAAITWVGSAIFLQIYVTRLTRAGERARVASIAGDIEEIGKQVFAPASGVLLVFGGLMIWYAPQWELTQLWVILALAGFAYTFVTGLFVIGPQATKVAQMTTTSAPDDPSLQAAIKRIFLMSRLDLLVLVLVVCDMVLKPGTSY
jgi:uncharacterized membrane protein